MRVVIGWGRRGRRKRRGRARRKGLRRRLLLAALLLLTVGGVSSWAWLSVQVRERFEARLWHAPARVYSDALSVSPGMTLSAEALAERLDRSGYARVADPPDRAGQYRLDGSTLELHARAFRTPVGSGEPGRYTLALDGDRIRRIRDAGGASAARVVLEPELLATLYRGRHEERYPIALDEVPQHFIDAVLAAEDARYFRHHGLDLRGIARAGWTNVRRGGIVQGGSTITQQTVKNLFLDQSRTWWRKLREVPLALVLDARYSKQRVLEVYLNEVYLGQRGAVSICGIEAAARFYFGRSVADLSVAESAVIAGLIKSPGSFNPFRHEDRSLKRRDQVLAAMARRGWLEPEALSRHVEEPLRLASGRGGYDGAPYAVDYAVARARELFPGAIDRPGVALYTSLDTHAQQQARAALVDGLRELESRPGRIRDQLAERELQGAVVVTRPEDGAILAMVGGRDYRRSQFNRVTQARRQPGSCFKPFVFLAAFEAAADRRAGALMPASLLADEPLTLRSGGRNWRPSNYDREFRGEVSARRALEESLNVPAVRAAQSVGMEAVIEVARDAGIESSLRPVPSLALGTGEVTPLELSTAYGTLARRGVRQPPRIVLALAGEDGEVLLPPAPLRRRVLRAQTTFLINDMLRGVFERGTARSARALGYLEPAAGKTGTTDDTRDSWFVGYDGERLALVWLGYDDNARTGLTGASGALPVWSALMRSLGPSRRRPGGRWPDGVIVRAVDPLTGELVSRYDPDGVEELFLASAVAAEPRARSPFRRAWERLRGRRSPEAPRERARELPGI